MKINIIALSIFVAGLGALQLRASDADIESKVQKTLAELVNFCAKAKERCELEMFVFTVKEGEKLFEEEVTKIGSLKAVLENKSKELSAEELAIAKVRGRCKVLDRNEFYVYQ